MKFNNILVPRNIEERKKKLKLDKEKLRQDRIKLLSQEILEGDLEIDESFEGISDELVKVKEIKGNVVLYLNYIPSLLKNVKVYGNFYCTLCNLISTENCPKYIKGDFYYYENFEYKLPEYVELKGKLINIFNEV